MFHLKNKKKKLNRKDFINLVDSDKIWSKEMNLEEIKEMIEYLKIEMLKYDFKIDKNFVMNNRRKGLKSMIEERMLNKDADTKYVISESLFNLWEFVNDEYAGNLSITSIELGIPLDELIKMDDEYRKKGIICIQEKDIILELMEGITKFIYEKNDKKY